jgi:hypothetical protein
MMRMKMVSRANAAARVEKLAFGNASMLVLDTGRRDYRADAALGQGRRRRNIV